MRLHARLIDIIATSVADRPVSSHDRQCRRHQRRIFVPRRTSHEGVSLVSSSASSLELCVQRLRWYQSIAREPARHAHLLCCWFGRMHFESHDTLIDNLHLHPGANMVMRSDYWQTCRRWLSASRLQTVNWMEFGDVFRLGSKLNEWFLSLDLRQFRAAFFTQTGIS